MSTRETRVLTIAEIVTDAAASNYAALARDFNEARFRAHLVVDKLEACGLRDVVDLALLVVDLLGPTDTQPQPGYGEAMIRLADRLEALGFDPC